LKRAKNKQKQRKKQEEILANLSRVGEEAKKKREEIATGIGRNLLRNEAAEENKNKKSEVI